MELDWENLGFDMLPTKGAVRVDYADGQWGQPEVITGSEISIHMGAQVLHYGQACFEGLKAFTLQSGEIALFRPDMNAKRMMRSAERICMRPPSEELFIAVCKKAVEINREYVPPHGTGASLYLRPLLIGTEPTFAIKPSGTYSFIVMVSPVGPYYKSGFSPVDALVVEEYDRAAPAGTGQSKVAGNYAASLMGSMVATEKGFPIVLYLDARRGEYIDEFGTSNFIGITGDGKYITPNSPSILQSITNDSLRQLAAQRGLTVLRQDIRIDSIDQFCEVGACGTAAVITPIGSITHRGNKTVFNGGEVGPILQSLYGQLQGIQYGDVQDRYCWLERV
jgi:branched-chain amino acid aminotransferase